MYNRSLGLGESDVESDSRISNPSCPKMPELDQGETRFFSNEITDGTRLRSWHGYRSADLLRDSRTTSSSSCSRLHLADCRGRHAHRPVRDSEQTALSQRTGDRIDARLCKQEPLSEGTTDRP